VAKIGDRGRYQNNGLASKGGPFAHSFLGWLAKGFGLGETLRKVETTANRSGHIQYWHSQLRERHLKAQDENLNKFWAGGIPFVRPSRLN